MNYQLPPYVLKDRISLSSWNPPGVLILLSETASVDKTQALADILCEIAHANTGYPYQLTPESGNYEVEHRFRVSVAGKINPFIHLPSYKVDALKAHPDSIEGAEGLVAIVSANTSCPHCIQSLDFIPPILKGTVAHDNAL